MKGKNIMSKLGSSTSLDRHRGHSGRTCLSRTAILALGKVERVRCEDGHLPSNGTTVGGNEPARRLQMGWLPDESYKRSDVRR